MKAPARTELKDGTLLLRSWRLEDVPRVTEACQDPEIPRWTAVIPEPYTEADARAWIEQTIRDWDEHREAAFAVTDAETGEVVGAIGLNLQQHYALQASIGYWVAKEARGRGVATAALRLVAPVGAGGSRAAASAAPDRSRQRGLAPGGREGRFSAGRAAASIHRRAWPRAPRLPYVLPPPG